MDREAKCNGIKSNTKIEVLICTLIFHLIWSVETLYQLLYKIMNILIDTFTYICKKKKKDFNYIHLSILHLIFYLK